MRMFRPVIIYFFHLKNYKKNTADKWRYGFISVNSRVITLTIHKSNNTNLVINVIVPVYWAPMKIVLFLFFFFFYYNDLSFRPVYL